MKTAVDILALEQNRGIYKMENPESSKYVPLRASTEVGQKASGDDRASRGRADTGEEKRKDRREEVGAEGAEAAAPQFRVVEN